MPIRSPKVISAGNTPENKKFLAVGDDSAYGDVLTYAFLIIKRGHSRTVKHKLQLLKKRFKIPEHVSLHCKILMHGDQRKKHDIDHLTREDTARIIRHAITIISECAIYLRYAYCYFSDGKRLIEQERGELEFTKDYNEKIYFQATPDQKGFLGLLMQSCWSVPENGAEGPTAQQCQIIASADSTKTEFIGSGKRQAHNRYNGYIQMPENFLVQLQPKIEQANDNLLLQLADIAAYACVQSLSDGANKDFYEQQLQRIPRKKVTRKKIFFAAPKTKK